MSGVRVVLCSVGSAEEAERLATGLVEERLAACVNVVPGVISIYRWRDAVQRDEERLLLIKTTADRLAALRAALVERHSYQLPEVLALEVSEGHAPYLAWVEESCAPGQGPAGR